MGVSAWGLTFPLITKADGTKFGKTEAGAVWLDPKKTSPYRFYQFFVNTEDSIVPAYLKECTTLLPASDVSALGNGAPSNPAAREAHKALAREITSIVHGKTACDDAVRASEIMFGGALEGLTEALFNDVAGEIPTKTLERSKLEGSGFALTDLLVHSGLCNSKGQARKDIEGGGIYVNNVRATEAQRPVKAEDLLFGKFYSSGERVSERTGSSGRTRRILLNPRFDRENSPLRKHWRTRRQPLIARTFCVGALSKWSTPFGMLRSPRNLPQIRLADDEGKTV